MFSPLLKLIISISGNEFTLSFVCQKHFASAFITQSEKEQHSGCIRGIFEKDCISNEKELGAE